jgi:hypothetical protein
MPGSPVNQRSPVSSETSTMNQNLSANQGQSINHGITTMNDRNSMNNMPTMNQRSPDSFGNFMPDSQNGHHIQGQQNTQNMSHSDPPGPKNQPSSQQSPCIFPHFNQ